MDDEESIKMRGKDFVKAFLLVVERTRVCECVCVWPELKFAFFKEIGFLSSTHTISSLTSVKKSRNLAIRS